MHNLLFNKNIECANKQGLIITKYHKKLSHPIPLTP